MKLATISEENVLIISLIDFKFDRISWLIKINDLSTVETSFFKNVGTALISDLPFEICNLNIVNARGLKSRANLSKNKPAHETRANQL
jgi:hypothetical protein